MILSLNASDQAIFDVAVLNYNTNMAAGQVGASKIYTPEAPFAWVLDLQPTGFTFYKRSDSARLTPTIPLQDFNALDAAKAPKPLNVISIGHPMGGKWYSMGQGDTFPNGMTTPPQADGHTYEKFGGIGPTVGWYLQVS